MTTATLSPDRSDATIRAALLVLSLAVLPSALLAQSQGNHRRPVDVDTVVFRIDPLVVTATRGPREVSRIPQPVSVVQQRDLVQQIPNTVTDLFRALPGVDVIGVGVSQGRPQIRGQRGTRILLLEDGLRVNSFRRQQDFGELPALVDVTGVERVEIVRGPSSVLYGSDAIGGVVNIINRTPQEEGLHGTGQLRYGSVESQRTGSARLFGRFGNVTLRAGGTVRNADPYRAPAGTFGGITLDQDAEVFDTGVKDRSWDVRLGWEPAGRHAVYAKVSAYSADSAGFGGVDPALYDPTAPSIVITYPTQSWTKFTAGYLAQELGTPLADRLEISAYRQRNERELSFAFKLKIGPGLLQQLNENYTDIGTTGFRAEARKLATPRLLLTYGVDYVKDHAEGTDDNVTSITGFGPPRVTTSDRPQLPEADFSALGAFLQGEVEVNDRISLVAGGRYQTVQAETFETPGLEDQDPVTDSDGTFVGAVNGIVDVGGGFSLVGSVGRAFRSPNLIERFFDGVTPEGSGYQVRNPDLKPETSFNTDLGMRYVTKRVSVEAFTFRNTIADGIRIEPLGTKVNGVAAYQNTNVDELLFRGVEVGGEFLLGSGFSTSLSYTWQDAENANDAEIPVGETFSRKATGTLRYTHPSDRFWTAFELRRNGEQKSVVLEDNPLGELIPSFTVMNLRGGVTVFRTEGGQTHRLAVALTNLTNGLYAEFSNASFFRPEPKRNLTLTWEVSF
ncbi:MAG: TonB-dependent receptor [Longimicrobiales bacterium]|nr:TonB-dependent receptor [Longimicrobiales bacterium]